MKTVWKTEGPSDLLALLSLKLPSDHSACCNVFGATETPNQLERFRGARVFVIHDCDTPGQTGAIEVKNGEKVRPGWVPKIAAAGAAEVRNVILPYPIVENHGKDLRDWINEQLGAGLAREQVFSKLLELAESMPIVAGSSIAVDDDELPGGGTNLEVIEEDDDPHRLARVNLRNYQDAHGGRLVFWRDEWWKYKGGRYRKIEHSELRAKVWTAIRIEFERLWAEATDKYERWRKSDKYNPDFDKGPPKVRRVTRGLVNNVVGAMESLCGIPSSVVMPSWLPNRTQPHYLSVANGILDLQAVFDEVDLEDCIRPHSPDWFSAVKLDYAFNPQAMCPEWLKYLDYAMEGDEDRIKLLQEWAGYLLTSTNDYQKFLALEGDGGNGKTVFFAGVEAMLGEENVSHVSVENFGGRFDLGITLGKAANISGDVGEIEQLAEGILKQFTGGDTMTFDRKNMQPISARPTAKLMMSWNHRPRIKDKSSGLWRRLIVVPFQRPVDESHKIFGMDSPSFWRSNGEVSGILLWAIIGLYRLKSQRRFTQPKICQQEVEEYRFEMNPAAMFIDDCCEAGSEADLIASSEIYDLYRKWCTKNGYSHPLTSNVFFRELKRKFPNLDRRKITVGDQRVWHLRNLKLLRDF